MGFLVWGEGFHNILMIGHQMAHWEKKNHRNMHP
jgi:hypothetical protein